MVEKSFRIQVSSFKFQVSSFKFQGSSTSEATKSITGLLLLTSFDAHSFILSFLVSSQARTQSG